jgi:hypothetical protein
MGDVLQVIGKKRMLAAIAVVDDLIGDGYMAGSHQRANAAYRRDGDDVGCPQFLQAPDIGAVIDFMRRNAMRIAVPRQKNQVFAIDLAKHIVGRRGAEGGFQVLAAGNA